MRPFVILGLIILLGVLGLDLGYANEGLQTIESWGQVDNPDGASEVQFDGQRLTIDFGPGGKGLGAENVKKKAPRVLQTLAGDFSIQVTVDGDLPLPDLDAVNASAYISGGIVLFHDDRNYIRLERASFTRRGTVWHYANFEQRIDAKRTRMGRFADFPLQSDKPVELRLEVKGEKVRALVRHAGDDWHELGIAKMKDRDRVMTGVSGVKTDAGRAKVNFRDLTVSEDLVAADAKSASGIDLNEIRRIIRIPQPANVQWKDLIDQVENLQQRAKQVGKLSEDEQTKLIDEAKKLGTRKTPKMKAFLGPSIARRLAENFQQAEMPNQAIRVYREVADALEQLREDGLTAAIDSLRQLADQLEGELSARKALPEK